MIVDFHGIWKVAQLKNNGTDSQLIKVIEGKTMCNVYFVVVENMRMGPQYSLLQ